MSYSTGEGITDSGEQIVTPIAAQSRSTWRNTSSIYSITTFMYISAQHTLKGLEGEQDSAGRECLQHSSEPEAQ